MPAGSRLLAAVAMTVLATAVSCARSVGGTAGYAPDGPPANSALVRASDLPPLVLNTADIDALLGMSGLEKVYVPAVGTLPAGVLSDPSCGAAMQTGWLDTYRVSGHIGAAGSFARNSHEQQVSQTVAAFRGGAAARAFIGAVIKQWKACIERPITQNAMGVTVNFMAFGPSRADGVDHLLIRREGGRGYACSHAIGANSNVTAEVEVCGPDETVVDEQSAKVVNAVLARIHR